MYDKYAREIQGIGMGTWIVDKTYDSVLEKLKGSGVVSFEVVDGMVRVEEQCDLHFSCLLSKEEISELIDELWLLHKECR